MFYSKLDHLDNFCPVMKAETAMLGVLVIRRYLKFTARRERELSLHPCCLHSFCGERWTWTSSDTTRVNVYLSPFLSSWEFALPPELKSPRLFLLFAAVLSVEQQTIQLLQSESYKSRNHSHDVTF